MGDGGAKQWMHAMSFFLVFVTPQASPALMLPLLLLL